MPRFLGGSFQMKTFLEEFHAMNVVGKISFCKTRVYSLLGALHTVHSFTLNARSHIANSFTIAQTAAALASEMD